MYGWRILENYIPSLKLTASLPLKIGLLPQKEAGSSSNHPFSGPYLDFDRTRKNIPSSIPVTDQGATVSVEAKTEAKIKRLCAGNWKGVPLGLGIFEGLKTPWKEAIWNNNI